MSAPAKPAAPNQPQEQKPAQLYRGIVKQVNSGDCLVIKSLVTGKNLEKVVTLSNVTARRLGRRLNANNPETSTTENDMPYAFEAREFLRKKLVGKEVCFVKDANAANDRGTLYLGKEPTTGENVIDSLVSAGLVEVRRLNKPSEEENRLVALEDQAKSQALGIWSKDAEANHVRNMQYTLENASNFVDSLRQKPVDAIVEYVRDGSTLRLLLLPSYQNVTVQLSGLKCPGFRRVEADKPEVPEPFAEEARQYVETRLLQRDVKVVLEGVANQTSGTLLGSIQHPAGNISELLLQEGLAKCVDWSMGVVTAGPEKYRSAEKQAKQAKLRLWKNYTQASTGVDDATGKTLQGKVVEVLNGDGVMVKLGDNTIKKVFLSSIRPPRTADFPTLAVKADKKNNPLYDVPYLFEAREFLRKKLIGKKVTCHVDYVQPKSDDYPEKVCCTVMLGETNIAEAIVSAGLAKVIRYKQDDDHRSSKYDDLLAAESRAQKKAVALHSAKEPTTLKIADASGDSSKAKQFLPSLQRAGRMDALVEFVSSGSRFKLYIPKETCLVTFLLSGIECPRMARTAYGNNPATPADEYGDEAYVFSKLHCLQHEVKVEVESIDKGGNFIGQLIADDGLNIAVGLVEHGYAAVHKSAASSSYFTLLSAAELKAKEKKLNRWKNYVEEVKVATAAADEAAEKSEPQERVVAHKKIVITEIGADLHFFGQHVESGPKLEQLTSQMRAELEARPPVPGAYTPKVGDLCVARFSMDDEWYRAKVLSVADSAVVVSFIDYGNKETTKATKLAHIPAGFEALPAQAHEFAFSLVQLSSDEDDNEAAVDYLKQLVNAEADAEFSINSEYKNGSVDFVTLFDSNKNDVGKLLISNGYVSVEKARRERRMQKMLTDYMKALTLAKQSHKNMWRYGDKEQDDALEFGISRK